MVNEEDNVGGTRHGGNPEDGDSMLSETLMSIYKYTRHQTPEYHRDCFVLLAIVKIHFAAYKLLAPNTTGAV